MAYAQPSILYSGEATPEEDGLLLDACFHLGKSDYSFPIAGTSSSMTTRRQDGKQGLGPAFREAVLFLMPKDTLAILTCLG